MASKLLKRSIVALLFFVIGINPTSSHAQTDSTQTVVSQDSITVSVETLNEIRNDLNRKDARIQQLEQLNANLRSQNENYAQTLDLYTRQDSILTRRMNLREEILDIQEEEIERLSVRVQQSERRKWLYYVGGVLTVVGSAYTVGQVN